MGVAEPLLPLAELERLAPAEVTARVTALAHRLEGAYAPNTLRALSGNLKLWRAYCHLHGHSLLPADVAPIEAFLEAARDGTLPGDAQWSANHDGAVRSRKRATIEQYVATLTLMYRLAQLPNPLHSVDGKLMWRALRRSMTKRQQQAAPLGRSTLHQIVAAIPMADARDYRDAALLHVASETMMRSAELVALDVGHIQPQPDGTARVLLARSKTDQEGKGQLRMMSAATYQRVRAWCEAAQIQTGALWRSKHGSRHVYGTRLKAAEVGRIFRRRAQAAGVSTAEQLSGHSARVGMAQDLAADNASVAAIMQAGGWSTPTMVARYTEAGDVGRGAVATLLQRERGVGIEALRGEQQAAITLAGKVDAAGELE